MRRLICWLTAHDWSPYPRPDRRMPRYVDWCRYCDAERPHIDINRGDEINPSSRELRDAGWHEIMTWDIPPRDQLVEFARDPVVHVQPPWKGRWRDLHPAFNIAGLFWRPIA